ncbi:MAG: hypothetical protein K2M19_00560 [Muribaculaceae bacterium]|nr:hypothetical protein [Muribaculaceae bacterium]
MADIRIAGIMRAGVFSPNHIGNDAAIFNMVADQLRKRGCEVNVYTEEELVASGGVPEPYIFNMCRDERSLEVLARLEDEGRLVINSAYGIRNCVRDRMTRIFMSVGTPYPESFIVDTDQAVKTMLTKAGVAGCWIKGGDVHTRHREDVAYARHPQEAQELLQEFFMRGLKTAVINRHTEGEQIKFYSVAGTRFFHWYYAFNGGHSRVGLSLLSQNDEPHMSFNADAFHRVCNRAAEALGIQIYGGDAVVEPDGKVTIIDFDDWPSFAPCRQEAAPIIARTIMSLIKKHNQE